MQIWYSPEIERNDFSSKIFFSTPTIPRAIHNGITAINADIYTEYYRAIGSCEKGLDKRIDAQSRYRAKGGRGGGRERERERKERRNVTKVAISFVNTIPVLGNGELL